MFAIKKYFSQRRRKNSTEYASTGDICTCPDKTLEVKKKKSNKIELFRPKFMLSRESKLQSCSHELISPPKLISSSREITEDVYTNLYETSCRRSISLDRISHNSVRSSSAYPYSRETSRDSLYPTSELLTSRDSLFPHYDAITGRNTPSRSSSVSRATPTPSVDILRREAKSRISLREASLWDSRSSLRDRPNRNSFGNSSHYSEIIDDDVFQQGSAPTVAGLFTSLMSSMEGPVDPIYSEVSNNGSLTSSYHSENRSGRSTPVLNHGSRASSREPSFRISRISHHTDSDDFNSQAPPIPPERELSEWEKENLLFLRDLDNSYGRYRLQKSKSDGNVQANLSATSRKGEASQGENGRHSRSRQARSAARHSFSKKHINNTHGYREDSEDGLAECEPSHYRSRNNSSSSYQYTDISESLESGPATDHVLAENSRARSRSNSSFQSSDAASQVNSAHAGYGLISNPRRRSSSSLSGKYTDIRDTSHVISQDNNTSHPHVIESRQDSNAQSKHKLTRPHSVDSHFSSAAQQYNDVNQSPAAVTGTVCKRAVIKPLTHAPAQETQLKKQSNQSQENSQSRGGEELPNPKYKDSGICTDVDSASNENGSIPGIVIAHLDEKQQTRLKQKAQRVAQLKNKFFEENSDIFSYLSDSSKRSSSSEKNNTSAWWNNKQHPNNQQVDHESTSEFNILSTSGIHVPDNHRNAITPITDFPSSQFSVSFSENQLPRKVFTTDSDNYVFRRYNSTESYVQPKDNIQESDRDSGGIRKSSSFDSKNSALQRSPAIEIEYFLPKNSLCPNPGISPVMESGCPQVRGIIIPHQEFVVKNSLSLDIESPLNRSGTTSDTERPTHQQSLSQITPNPPRRRSISPDASSSLRARTPSPGSVRRARRSYSKRCFSLPTTPFEDLSEEPSSSPECSSPPTPSCNWSRSPTRIKEVQEDSVQDTGRKNSDNTQKSPSEEVPSVQTKGTSGNVEQNVSDVRQATEEQVTKKATPMAFTIDLGTDTEEGSGDQANKKLDINASISKWAPKHRRNLSLSKVEENKKVEERGKPPVGRPRSGTLGSPLSSSGIQQPPQRRATGYHSEGYFSSDQDDEPRRIELNKPRSPRTPEAKSPMGPQRVMRSASQDSARGASLRMRSPSPDAGGRASAISNERATALSNELSMTMSLNESASRLLERMIANTPEPKRKLSNISGKSEGSSRQCCLGEKKPTVAELIGSYKSSKKDTKASEKMSPTGRKQSISAQSLSSCHTYDVNQEEDAVSEAGTYTIGNESPDVEAARSNIDNVFGVPAAVSPAGAKTNNQAANQPWENSAENMSRASPNWIQQWAAQVAEQTKSPLGPATSPLGNKQPVTSPSPESVGGRPRRKLPNVPTGQASASPHSSLTLNSPRASDFSDVESSNKALVDSTSSSAAVNSGLPGSPFASQDSGGDSDIDTLTSYPQTDNETRLSEAIRSKLKLSNLESTSKPKQLVSGLSRPEVNLQGRLKLGLRRERSTMSDVGYDSFAAVRQEQHCMQSDSSSETSENIKEVRKPAEKNPPLMKYNRAFSLRRARLDENTAAPVEKTKPTRASSATSVNGRSKAPLTASKSVQGDYSKHVSSKPQVNSPQGPVKDITREDGGRFSLRTTRSASTTNVSKSPPRKNLKKDLLRRAIPSRSNSTMSSKEAEFQNWKRRKNYDPRKAAAEGRKKQADKKVEEPSGETEEERTPSPQLLRSQSFHGTEGMVAGKKWPQKGNQYDHDEPSSATEDEAANIPQSSPLRRCDTSPHSLASPTHSTSPARQAQINAANAARRRKSYTLSDDGEGNNTSNSRKTSFDESESEGKSSPMGSTRGGGRAKVKMEALDNLVISTIHSLSVKVRTTSETLLQKLRSQYDEEGDRAALLEDVLAHLTESDQTLTPSQSRSTSRELAGILRNLKKIEHALEVVDRVLVYDDEEDDLDDEDLDGTVCNEWTEDY